jgi:hypothetical protein
MRPAQCPYCGMVFNITYLNEHIRIAHGQRYGAENFTFEGQMYIQDNTGNSGKKSPKISHYLR